MTLRKIDGLGIFTLPHAGLPSHGIKKILFLPLARLSILTDSGLPLARFGVPLAGLHSHGLPLAWPPARALD